MTVSSPPRALRINASELRRQPGTRRRVELSIPPGDVDLGDGRVTGDVVVAGPDHPLRFAAGEHGPHPYVEVRSGLEALVARPVYYELANIAIAESAEPPGIWSGGAFFPLDGRS